MNKNKQNRQFEMIVLGPPVSGKGTQADLLSQTFNIPHLSAGQLLHEWAKKKNNRLAVELKKYLDAGLLVPHEWINKLILNRIKQKDCRYGFVLDGYPRAVEQVQVINRAARLDYVFLIEVPDKTILARITGRRVCPKGHTWHVKFNPTKRSGVCDTCGQPLHQRADDKPSVAKDRLKIYHQEIDPILAAYQKNKKLIRVNGDQNIEKVFQEMVKYLVDDLRSKIK